VLRRTPIKKKSDEKNIGQSTVEYIILFAAVIAVMIIFLRPGGYFQNTLNQTLNVGANSMLNMAIRLKNSAPLAQ
jgi:UDP-glucose 4-epimerase